MQGDIGVLKGGIFEVLAMQIEIILYYGLPYRGMIFNLEVTDFASGCMMNFHRVRDLYLLREYLHNDLQGFLVHASVFRILETFRWPYPYT